MLNLNQYELATLADALLLTAGYLVWRGRSWQTAIILLLIALPALSISIHDLSQFMTFDENYISVETLNVHHGDIPQQYIKIRARTSNALLSGVIGILDRLSVTVTQQRMVLKCLYWLLTFAGLLAIHRVLENLFVLKTDAFFLLYFYLILLLPTNLLAMKVYMPDALAIMLGMLAVLLLYYSLKHRTDKYAVLNVVIAYLAAQEKFILSPILILVLVSYAYLKTACSESSALKHTLNGVGVCLLVGLVTSTMLYLVMGSGILYFVVLLTTIADPLIGWIWPIAFNLGLTFGGELTPPRTAILPLLLVVVILIYSLTLVLRWALARINFQQLFMPVRYLNIALVLLLFSAAICSTFFQEIYLAPVIEIAPGHFSPPGEFNSFRTHFGAVNLLEHIAASTAYASAMFINAVPTVLWGIFLLTLWKKTEAGYEILLLCGLLTPLIFGVMLVPALSRYMNFSLFLMTIALLLKLGTILENVPYRGLITGGIALLLVLEILPFGPLYGGFRPFWINYDEKRSEVAVPGRLDPFWWGWGEETLLAGREIMERCTPDCQGITLYSAFGSDWMDEQKPIKNRVFVFDSRLTPDDLSYTALDYYLINRVNITHGHINVPPIEPLFTIDNRGYVYAWVYRGDMLGAAGFRFEWEDITGE